MYTIYGKASVFPVKNRSFFNVLLGFSMNFKHPCSRVSNTTCFQMLLPLLFSENRQVHFRFENRMKISFEGDRLTSYYL